MPYKFSLRQKSPKRRFLLILGLTTLIACITLGLMFMFWDKLIQKLDMSTAERLGIGALFIIYGLLRFLRLFKVDPEDEE
jgi:hypothetical protein